MFKFELLFDTMEKLEDLFEKTRVYILTLSKKTCLSSFYIGKADDINERRIKHQKEGYQETVEIAHSDRPENIDGAERYLIEKIRQEKMPVILENINNGGGGNPKANKLYVSLHFDMKNIDELGDDDILQFNSIKM